MCEYSCEEFANTFENKLMEVVVLVGFDVWNAAFWLNIMTLQRKSAARCDGRRVQRE